MNTLENQILLFFIFILCISLITYYYVKRQNIKNFENFENSNLSNLSNFDNNEIQITLIKTAVNKSISDYNFNSIINRYSIINPSIIVDNNGKLCDLTTSKNICEIDNSIGNNDPQCLVNGINSSCNKIFIDDVINNYTNIDLNSLISVLHSNILSATKLLNEEIQYRSAGIDDTLNLILNKQDLINQQIFTIAKNDDNLISKKNDLQSTTEDFKKNENDVFINQYNFQNFLIQNNNNNKTITLYRNILYGLIITIIIVGIFLYFVS